MYKSYSNDYFFLKKRKKKRIAEKSTMEREWNFGASLVAEMVKNPPIMQETQV